VIRLGALGDIVQMTPIIRLLHEDGYEVDLNIKKYSADVLRNNLYVNNVIVHDDSIPNEKLDEHWEQLGVGYDKVVNLSESVERGLLAIKGDPAWDMSKEERHELMNVNYFDRQLEIAGFNQRGILPELYFSTMEMQWARDFRKKHKREFLVLIALSGSSLHKVYPHMEIVMRAFHEAHPDTRFITVGDVACQLLEPEAPYVIPKSDKWSIRKSMLMTKYADLVISPETGLLNASGCFDTPKIALLSHSSVENLTKHFKNCASLSADIKCYPCHKLHYSMDTCNKERSTDSPACMAKISPATVLNAMEDVYIEWRI